MVVKNESQLIREALRSVESIVDRSVFVDTGSTDNTTDIIRTWDGSCTIHKREWKDYSHNRNEALDLARQSGCDWILILDADETLIVPPDFKFENLNPDNSYWFTNHYGQISYTRPSLINAKQNWKYTGVTHEYLFADPMPPSVLLPVIIQTHPSRCTKSAERCREDIDLLYKGLAEEPNNSRYVFYLAQSYRDAGDLENALLHYKRRTTLGGWYEELFDACMNVARIMERLDYSREQVVDAYLKAYNVNPDRSESLGSLARYLRIKEDYNTAYMMADKAAAMPRPNQLLFIDETFYDWKNQDELSISAFWTGRYELCKNICDLLLNSGRLPLTEVARVMDNRQHAVNKLEGK